MIGPIRTVAVYVEDQERALEFYTGLLGFELRRRESMGPDGAWIEVAPPGAQSCLVLYPRSMMANWQELKPSVVFHCDDVEATCRELAAKGVTIGRQPREMPWGMFASFLDPDGNEFVLTTPRAS